MAGLHCVQPPDHRWAVQSGGKTVRIRCVGGLSIRLFSCSRLRFRKFSLKALVVALWFAARGQPGFVPSARAEPAAVDRAEVRKGRQLYRLGKEAYAAGRFAEAYDHFEAGYRLSGRSPFLLNMAHAKRRQGELAAAHALSSASCWSSLTLLSAPTSRRCSGRSRRPWHATPRPGRRHRLHHHHRRHRRRRSSRSPARHPRRWRRQSRPCRSAQSRAAQSSPKRSSRVPSTSAGGCGLAPEPPSRRSSPRGCSRTATPTPRAARSEPSARRESSPSSRLAAGGRGRRIPPSSWRRAPRTRRPVSS